MQRQEEVSEKEGTWDEKRKIKRNIRINTEVVFASLGTARLMKEPGIPRAEGGDPTGKAAPLCFSKTDYEDRKRVDAG
jgi:hypothetical protein